VTLFLYLSRARSLAAIFPAYHPKRPFQPKFSHCINSWIAAKCLANLKHSRFDENHTFLIGTFPFDAKKQWPMM
jgi:hypothetical protein